MATGGASDEYYERTGLKHGVMQRIERKRADEQETDDEIRIVLFGKTGSGKSASGNTILGPEIESDPFKESHSFFETTKMCKRRSVQINGQNLRVIDTPGLLDPSQDKDEIANELARCLLLSSPGPHIFLFVLNITDRITEQEILAYNILRELFETHLNRYVVVLFTHGDKLQNKETMETVLKRAELAFQRDPHNMPKGMNYIKMLLDDVQNRKIMFSNRGDQATKDQQVLELLRLISVMKENNAPMPFFSDKKTKEASGSLSDMVDDYMTRYPYVSRKKAMEEVMWKTDFVRMSALRLIGASVSLGFTTLFVLPFVPAGVGLGGILAAGAAASAAGAAITSVASVVQKRNKCSVM